MNLRKKKTSFNYQDTSFLSKNYQYEELTKGKHRQQADDLNQEKEVEKPKGKAEVRQEEDKDYNLIFTQLMDSIRKNMGEKRVDVFSDQDDEEEEGEEVIGKQGRKNKDGSKLRVETKKEVNVGKMKRMREGNHLMFKYSNNQPVDPESNSSSSSPSPSFEKVYPPQKPIQHKNSTDKPTLQSFRNPKLQPPPHHHQNPQQKYQTPKISPNISQLSKIRSTLLHHPPPQQPQYLNYYNQFLLGTTPPHTSYNRMGEGETKTNDVGFVKKEGKLFNRSSYHIAIAYHIHFKKNEYYKDPLEIDPTYHAKKMMQAVGCQKK